MGKAGTIPDEVSIGASITSILRQLEGVSDSLGYLLGEKVPGQIEAIKNKKAGTGTAFSKAIETWEVKA